MTEQNTGWRDISTAPKDWRNILLYPSPDGFNDDVVVGFFTEGMGNQWLTKQDALTEAETVTPTHWQPLPPPPGEEVESELEALQVRCDMLEAAERDALSLLADYVETDSPLPTQRSARVIRKLRSVVDGGY